jgi:hypothetical protein
MKKSEGKTKHENLKNKKFPSLDNSLKGSPNDLGKKSIQTNEKDTCIIK